MTQTLRVVAHVVAKSDQIEALKAVLLDLVVATRCEVGCIQYDLCQNIDNAAEFTFIEEWIKEEALKAHLAGENIKIAMDKINGLVASGPDIRVYHQLE